MFSGVNNKGGKAACQMDLPTFRIMRKSQSATWDDVLLASNLDDLKSAQQRGRNLMSEKYARMMESTFPEEYVDLADRLPPVDSIVAEQIEEIVAIHVRWKEALDERYPHLGDRGRPVRSQYDSSGLASLETYMRAELKTYSPRTIALYHADTLKRVERGESEAEQNLLNQVRQYGFANLEEAEKYFSTHV
jgi:hypothetical protein